MIWYLATMGEEHQSDEAGEVIAVVSPMVFPAPDSQAAGEIAQAAADELGIGLFDDPVPIWAPSSQEPLSGDPADQTSDQKREGSQGSP